MSSSQISSPVIPDFIAFGNVLLDMTAEVENTEILDSHGLNLDAQGELSSKTLREIAELVSKRYKVAYNPGGSALNTCRIFRKLNSVKPLFFGAVGNDEYASKIRDMLNKTGLTVSFQVVNNVPTGQCVCFVYGDKTGLYANIGASQKFSKEFLLQKATEFVPILKDEKKIIFYIEGYFVPGRFEVCAYIVKTYLSKNKQLALNLSSDYIIRENFEGMKYLVESASFVFGNKKEFTALANLSGFKEIEDVAKLFLSKERKVLVCTNGSQNIYVYENISSEYKCYEFAAKKVSQEDIVDTTGAGDSFVAGFLSAFLTNKSLVECVAEGCDVASVVITQVGCNMP